MVNQTLMIVIETGFVSRSLLWSDFLPDAKRIFKKIVILVRPAKLAYFTKLFCGEENIVVEAIEQTKDSFFKEKFFTLLKFSIPTTTAKNKLMRNLFLQRGFVFSSWFFYFLPVYTSWHLSRFKPWRRLLRWLYAFISPEKEYLNLLKKHQVDILYINYGQILGDNFNLKLIKAAKELGILTVGNVSGWDNLQSKTLIAEHTDFLTVANDIMKQDAIKLADFEPTKVKIIGAPHFDFYSKKELLLPKSQFFESIGASFDKPLMLFASGLSSLPIDYDYFFSLFDRLARKQIGNIQFYLRPHPKHYFKEELIEKYRNSPALIFEQRPKQRIGINFELNKQDNQLLFNLLYYADVVSCFFSTLLIEACLMDKPVISLEYFGKQNLHFWQKPERYVEQEHISQIFQKSFASRVKNEKELIESLKQALSNPEAKKEMRLVTAKEQLCLTDGSSARKAAFILKEIAVR